MNKTGDILPRALGLFFATLFVIVTLIALLAWNITRQAASAPAIKQALRSQNVYSGLPALIADQIALVAPPCPENDESCEGERAGKKEREGAQDYLRFLNKNDWQIVFSALMPENWLQGQTEGLIDSFFAYLTSVQPRLSLPVSLVDFKSRLKGQEGIQAFTQLIQSHPACTTDQLLAMKNEIQNPGPRMEELPLCMPPEGVLAQFTPQIGAVLAAIAGTIPDQVDLAVAVQADPAQQQSLDMLRQNYRNLSRLAALGPLVSIGLLLLIGLAAIRSSRELLAWWGIPFLIAGVLGILLAVLLVPIMSGVIGSALSGAAITQNIAPAILQTLESVLGSAIGAASLWMGLESGVLTVIGLGMTGIYFLRSL